MVSLPDPSVRKDGESLEICMRLNLKSSVEGFTLLPEDDRDENG
jgi:hypothetical protein